MATIGVLMIYVLLFWSVGGFRRSTVHDTSTQSTAYAIFLVLQINSFLGAEKATEAARAIGNIYLTDIVYLFIVSLFRAMATIRSELSILLLLAALCTYGQRESLTDDFAYLSAKERTKIAKKERNEAAADTAFKRLMSDGEIAFRNREYADALQLFKDARARRPYNVNPKVKIEDLEALLKREQVAAAETPATEPIEQNEIASETIPATIPDEIESPPKASLSGSLEASAEPVKKSISTAVTVTKRRKSPGVTPVRAKEEQLTGTTADGIEQRIFMQGTARVLERSLSENGTLISYRKVTHEWGAIHYFRGASTITKRKWDEVFSAQ